MLPIYICEDDTRQLESIKKLISEIIKIEGLSGTMDIVCASTNPQDIIDHLHKNPKQSLYFLDIDLGNAQMNGLDLGGKIRKVDPRGYIIIMTVHTEMTIITFRRKVEAMDFIEKDEPLVIPKRVRDCMIHALELYNTIPESQQTKKISFISNKKHITKNLHEIYLIEAITQKPGKIRIYEKDKFVEASLTLNKIGRELDKTFYQCHKSYIVNLSHISEINHKSHVVVMDNGNEVKISTRGLKKIEKYYIDFITNQ